MDHPRVYYSSYSLTFALDPAPDYSDPAPDYSLENSCRHMHLLIAPNAFKNSLSAAEVAKAIRRGLDRSRLSELSSIQPSVRPYSSECFPVGDGGDGTGDLLIERLGGHRFAAEARDPFGRRIMTYWGLCSMPPNLTDSGSTSGDISVAVIEMANASGLRLLEQQDLNPIRANSAGTGDLIRAALDWDDKTAPDSDQPGSAKKKLKRIIIGMGGSATVDGGTGILQSLGVRFLNANGQLLQDLPGSLTELASIDLSDLDPRLPATELIVLCDVNNPLTGPQGAAVVFGPQKGASPRDVQRLNAGLTQLAKVVHRQTGIDISSLPRGGTAGGAAAGLHGLLSARLVSGIDYFLEVTGFDAALDRSDWVITGEGSIDEQTLQGKAPFGVAQRAKKRGIPVIGLAGRLPAEIVPGLNEYFDMLLPISPESIELDEALRLTAVYLEQTANQLGDWLTDR
jgi:glycerate kinase